jgi:hypothetical protein
LVSPGLSTFASALLLPAVLSLGSN